ncbi:hypothetical protein EXIGLDRAFT_694975 [Exidia glandulosa HHB12029]|uniref:F-box domain-containing protein n=1 Tax=Exidia glandulosa HHB12029 TaxID=1314781 RepID=A0A165G8Y5_EXIGL|nr:hypothetical protein EXIGLDRAFT_694975 [Exidia glandulosa HHB12029]
MRIASSFILLSISATLVSAWPFQSTKNVTASTSTPALRLSKRAGRPTDDCNGVWLRATDGPTGKEVTCKAGTKGYELAATNPRVLATTNLERDGQAKAVADELVLKQALNARGGVCEKAKAMKDQDDALKRIYAIRKVAQSNNLVFLQNQLDGLKSKFASSPVATPLKPYTELQHLALENYLSHTQSTSLAVAAALDKAIAQQFPDATAGVKAAWEKYLTGYKAVATAAKLQAQKKIQQLKQQAAQNAQNANNCEAGKDASKPATRRMIPLVSFPGSSLTRRAPAARVATGPNAPPGPSCPIPGAQGKKVVPREQIKTKAPPATPPRLPATKPTPKAFDKPKKVLPRPPNRPKRQPGQVAPPPKRVTPKKVPRKVPLSEGKSKGTPRGRRNTYLVYGYLRDKLQLDPVRYPKIFEVVVTVQEQETTRQLPLPPLTSYFTELPVELLRTVMEHAAEAAAVRSLSDLVALLRVSTAVKGWLAPIVYRTVHLDSEPQWRAFYAAAKRDGALPVVNFSIISYQPPTSEFTNVLDVLPLLRNLQCPLYLVPCIPDSSARITRLFISKHGPATPEPPRANLCPTVTHIFYEPFYTGLYPASMRTALPLAFPNATHFGILYVATAGEAVTRDLMTLARDCIALPEMRRFYIRVYAQTIEESVRDTRTMCDVARETLRDPRIVIGAASLDEWVWKPGRRGCKPVSTLWAADAHGEFDLWMHGEQAYGTVGAEVQTD